MWRGRGEKLRRRGYRRYPALAATAVQLDDEVDNRGGVFDRLRSCQADARLHRHERDLVQRSTRRVGVDGGERAGVARVDRAKKADRLAAAQFPKHDPVGAQAKRGLNEIIGTDPGFAQFTLYCDQADAVFSWKF